MKSVWTNPKYGKKEFSSQYSRLNGERVFELLYLTGFARTSKTFTFESWQMAKQVGWVRK